MKKKRIALNAPITLAFVTICLLATVLNTITRGTSNELLFSVYRSGLTSPLTYLRFFTHIFGHSGWSHFIGNAAYLLLLGPVLEEKYGYKKLLCVIAAVAFSTGIISYILFPRVALCGASGVVFAFILLTAFTVFNTGEIPVTVILVALLFIGQQIYDGIVSHDNISQLSHIIGGVVGAACGYLWKRKA